MENCPKILIVNADDFGLSEPINRGIESAFTRGILRSASIMPNGQAFEDAVRIAAARPGLGVGMHLSLVDEQCLAQLSGVHGLANARGHLPRDYREFLFRWMMREFGERQIRREVRAQISRVLDAGIQPSHLDSHQHLHLFPPVLAIVLEEAIRTGIRVIRLPDDGSPHRGAKGAILSRLSRHAGPRLRGLGIRSVNHFWGLAESGRMVETSLLRTLAGLKTGINEIMCHPGFSDPATRARYPWQYHWDEETAALSASSVHQSVERQNIRLANFLDAWDA